MNSIGISARLVTGCVLVSMVKTKLEQLQRLALSLKQKKKEKEEERMAAKNAEKKDDVPEDGGAEPHAPRAMKRLRPAESAPVEPVALKEPDQKKVRHRQKTPDPAATAPSTPPRKTSRGLKRSPEPAREPEADASMPLPRQPARTKKPKAEEPPADVCGLPQAPTFPVTWDNIEKLMDFYKISEADATAVLLQVCGPNESAQQFWTKFKKDKGEPAAPAEPAKPSAPVAAKPAKPSAPAARQAKPSAPAARQAKPSAPAVAAEPAKPSAPAVAAEPAKPSAPAAKPRASAAKPSAPAAPPAVPEKPAAASTVPRSKGTLPYKNREEWINTLDSQPRSDDDEDDEWFPEYDLGNGVDGEPLTEEG